jgi:hypothetical protein
MSDPVPTPDDIRARGVEVNVGDVRRVCPDVERAAISRSADLIASANRLARAPGLFDGLRVSWLSAMPMPFGQPDFVVRSLAL